MGTHVNNEVSIPFTSNGKSEFVPRDKFPFTCCLLIIIFTHEIVLSGNLLSIKSCFELFYLLIYYFERFLNQTFAVTGGIS